MQASVTRRSKFRTACDRCYELKERCDRASPSAHCARCARLSVTCSTVRPVRPVGRRAQYTDSVTRLASKKSRKLAQNKPIIGSPLNVLPDLQPEEQELLSFFLSQSGNLDRFIAYPSSQSGKQQLFSVQLSSALPSFRDAFLACALSVKQLQTGTTGDADTTFSVRYILKAMDALRSLPVLSSQDAVLCHALGGLLAFSISSAIGVGVPDICRHCLGTTTPFMTTTVSDAQDDPWGSFLILLETMDCLMHRQKPILRIRVPTSVVIDCRLGLCLPLLPYYHDLCVISNTLLNTTDTNVLARLQKQLDEIHCIVEPWQPSQLNGLIERFDSTEIVHLLAQAKIYRLGALLVGHRLRYPFGQEDSQAEIWSKEVMMELEMARLVTKKPMRFVTLPFIIAAVEVREENLRVKTLECVDDCVDDFARFMQKATKTFLLRVWHERDADVTTRWFDSIHKPCPVLNALTATCSAG
ncbi:putative transcription factor cys6 protein [Botrytis fragariae]|uniref:Putative transcription factor cys6 protein n=1 Tax=Botrytis fragariae TaxID=1964551 RepID=A0A8H6EEH3_9HELO|nr:putative transcription factor cys6 protein [Botrytis fragariae]KAF5869206.1 putative transcription factor cys6 protein [Botrytis fragariae]